MLKLKKYILIFVLIPALVIPAGAQTARNINNFRDVSPDSWYYPYVKRLYEDGLINGVSENMFAPEQTVKTSEVAAMITRYLGLENTARKRHETLAANNAAGHGYWYAGYLQVLRELYIIDDAYLEQFGLRLDSRGQVIISGEAANLIDAPVKRMDIVKMIADSFEQRASNILKSPGLLAGEIGGSGNEFIRGGGYDRELLDWIAFNKINDYEDIARGYRTQFLKLFYNGIISGNTRGQVLPDNYLTRAELARIIASVMYFDLRDADLRELPEACVINPGDFEVSSADGTKFLKSSKAAQILSEQAKNISAGILPDGRININIEQKNIIPAGYINEIYIYVFEGSSALEIGKMNGAADMGAYFPRSGSFRMAGSANPAGYVYLVLRDLTRNGEIAGAVMLNIGPDGRLTDAPVYNLP